MFFNNADLPAKPAKDLDVRLPLGSSWSSVLAEFWTATERNSILNLGTPTRTSSSSISLLESGSRMLTMARQWYVSLRRIIPTLTKCFQSTTEEAAKDIAAFVAIFFENFSKFKGRAFHMAGESYGVCLYLRIRPSFTDPVLGSLPPRLCL